MGGVEIAIHICGPAAAPGQLALGIKHQEPAVMLVTGFAMQHVAEGSFAHHAQEGEHALKVADVLQHHAGDAGLFRGVHQVPALAQGDRRRHFDARILAGAHGGDSHPAMPIPRRGNDHRIEIRPPQQLLPGELAAGIHLGEPARVLLNSPGGILRAVRQQVADSADVHPRELQEHPEQAAAPVAHADHAQADGLELVLGGGVAQSEGCRSDEAGLQEGTAGYFDAVVHGPPCSPPRGESPPIYGVRRKRST